MERCHPRKFLTSFLLACVFFAPLAPRAEPLDVWHWRNPLPAAGELVDTAWGNGVHVAVGSRTILTSTDGADWSYAWTGHEIASVDFLDDVFVAGAEGAILTSGDGDDWTAAPVAPGYLVLGSARGNGRFVAVGQAYRKGKIFSSPDGLAWEEQYDGIGKTLAGVAFGAGTFVVVGEDGVVLTSADGESWSETNVGEAACFRGVVFGNGEFVAVGWRRQADAPQSVMVSPDGSNWEWLEASPNLDKISWADGSFTALTGGRVTASSDGRTWSPPLTPFGLHLKAVGRGGGQYTAVGGCGRIFTSPDGVEWTRRDSRSAGGYVGRVVDTGEKLVGLLSGGRGTSLVVSRNGETWKVVRPESFKGTGAIALAYGDGRLVAVGRRGQVRVSDDAGRTWRAGNSGTRHALVAVSYGAGRFVALSNIYYSPPWGEYSIPFFSIYTSADGLTWSRSLRLGKGSLAALAYGGGRFVAVGSTSKYPDGPGVVLVSTDGRHWTQGSHRTAFLAVAYGGGVFAAAAHLRGRASRTYLSGDGLSWTRNEGSLPLYVSDLAYGAKTFALVGGTGRYEGSLLYTSTDGISWIARPAGCDSLSHVAYGSGTFIATGGCGAILQSDPVWSPLGELPPDR